jgi:hypothetical protein
LGLQAAVALASYKRVSLQFEGMTWQSSFEPWCYLHSNIELIDNDIYSGIFSCLFE